MIADRLKDRWDDARLSPPMGDLEPVSDEVPAPAGAEDGSLTTLAEMLGERARRRVVIPA